MLLRTGPYAHTSRHSSRTTALIGLMMLPATLPAVYAGGPAAIGRIAGNLDLPTTSAAPVRSASFFEANQGQSDPSVLYLAHIGSGVAYFQADRVVLTPASNRGTGAATGQGTAQAGILALQFLGASKATVSAENTLQGKANYIIGNDPSKWHVGLPTYAAVTYSHLYDGVDLRYEARGSQLKGTYTLAPGAQPASIRWRYGSASAVSVDSQGNLHAGGAGGGALFEQAPVAWQQIGGTQVPVSARYQVGADGSIGFAVGSYDARYPLVIDPAITYSTYLGGSSDDYANGIAADAAGNAYVVGFTNSADFPTQNPLQPSKHIDSDVFVTKFNPDGTLAFSTFFGGGSIDTGYGIAVDSTGAIYITGQTGSTDFPVAGAYQSAHPSGVNVFVSKLSNDGASLLYSTYLGGSNNDYAYGIAADGTGSAYVEGNTNSDDFPTRNAFQGARKGDFDAFVTRLNTNATGNSSLVYSTYLGGTQIDYGSGSGSISASTFGHGIAADGSGRVYAAGTTFSNDFPSRNGFQPSRDPSANSDAWIASLNTNASGDASLLYATFLGGTNGDAGRGVALGPDGNVYVTGVSSSGNFPVRNQISGCTTNTQPFVARLNTSQAGNGSLVYATCIGSAVSGSSSDVVVDDVGRATILGTSASNTWPQVNSIRGWSGGQDAVLAKLNSAGNGLVYSTYLGGSANDFGYGLAHDGKDYVYITGQTNSSNYPTLNPFQSSFRGAIDGYATKIDECSLSFTDVHTSDYFYQPLRYLNCRNVISGYGDNTFRPGNNTSRGQMAKIVVLGLGIPLYTPATATFNDVPVGSTFYPYVETVAHYGIAGGYGCGAPGEPCPGQYFRPGDNVTRGQLSKIVVLAARLAKGWTLIDPATATFNDVPKGSTFYTYVETAVAHGLISGYQCGAPGEPCPGQYFRPGNNATRGQISKIVYLAVTSTASYQQSSSEQNGVAVKANR